MTKGEKTLLMVLGGAAVLGAGGYAVYKYTQKSQQVQNTPPPNLPPATAPVVNPTTTPELNALVDLTRKIQQVLQYGPPAPSPQM